MPPEPSSTNWIDHLPEILLALPTDPAAIISLAILVFGVIALWRLVKGNDPPPYRYGALLACLLALSVAGWRASVIWADQKEEWIVEDNGHAPPPLAEASAASVVLETPKPTTDCLHRLPGTYARTRGAEPDATVELFNERAVVRWHGSPPKTATFEHIGDCRWTEVEGSRWFDLLKTGDALKWGHGAEWRKHWG